jgi:macrolide-specific efflux system membrane fusion protein
MCIAIVIAAAIGARSHAGDPLVVRAVVLRPLVEAEVPARQVGLLQRIAVEEGAAVEAGDLLASLDDRIAALALRQAEIEAAQARAKAANELSLEYADKALEVARAELNRSQESNEKFPNSISGSQLDVERLTVEKLELERRQAEHELELARFDLHLKETARDAARLQLQLHAIEAPFAGVVALVRARAGEWVEPGAPVVRLLAVDPLRAEGFAPADAVNANLLGTEAAFRLAIDEEANADDNPVTFTGVIRFVSPEVDPVTGQVRIWAEIHNPDRRLRPGQQGQLLLPQ